MIDPVTRLNTESYVDYMRLNGVEIEPVTYGYVQYVGSNHTTFPSTEFFIPLDTINQDQIYKADMSYTYLVRFLQDFTATTENRQTCLYYFENEDFKSINSLWFAMIDQNLQLDDLLSDGKVHAVSTKSSRVRANL